MGPFYQYSCYPENNFETGQFVLFEFDTKSDEEKIKKLENLRGFGNIPLNDCIFVDGLVILFQYPTHVDINTQCNGQYINPFQLFMALCISISGKKELT